MNRREFLKMLGRGATIAGASPGTVGKMAMNLATDKTPINLTAIISNHLMNHSPVYMGGVEDFPWKNISEVADEATGFIQKSYAPIFNALNKSGVSLPFNLTTIASGIVSKLDGIKNFAEFSIKHPDQIPTELAIEECAEMLNELYGNGLGDTDNLTNFNMELIKFGFETNQITPEAQKHLEKNYEIYKCDFVDDPASEARKDEVEAKRQKYRDDYEKERYRKQQVQRIAKDINYSRMDRAGGSEDEGYAITYEKFFIENYADGKKPGRKGLAKRSGVNCKQSVSKLRKIAKNSTGERRRMAHWCANMKAGKKKKR